MTIKLQGIYSQQAAKAVKETPEAMAELAQHCWDELQTKEANAVFAP